MQSNEIVLLNKFGLAKNGNFNYSESSNAFLGNGYTSMAGNTYFNAVRLMDGIVIKEDVGHGHTYSFINAIRIYEIQSKNLICERNYHCTIYNERLLKHEVISMLFDILIDAAKVERIQIVENEVYAQIEKIVNKTFQEDQRQILFNQSQKYLGA